MTSFARSPRSTLGIEWELALVDRSTRALVPLAPQILERLPREQPHTVLPHATPELLTNTIELVTAPHATVSGAVADLAMLAESALIESHRLGASIIGSGTHPFSTWPDQHVTHSDRYERFINRYRWWGHNMLIWGVHVHVGVDRQDRVVPIMQALLTDLPVFLAFSASSPFWGGEPTGYQSNRTLFFQQLPSAGLPPDVSTWEELDNSWEERIRAGIIADPSEARWDIRPAPRWGTLEIRVCDGATSLRELSAIAALAQCMVEHYQQLADRGLPLPRLPEWCVRENKWRAARYGFDTDVITQPSGEQQSLRDIAVERLSQLTPIADRLGCLDAFPQLHRILDTGNSAKRQLDHVRNAVPVAAGIVTNTGNARPDEPALPHPLAPAVDLLVTEFEQSLGSTSQM